MSIKFEGDNLKIKSTSLFNTVTPASYVYFFDSCRAYVDITEGV